MSDALKKFLVFAASASLLLIAWSTGLLDLLGDVDRVRTILAEGGYAAPIAYLVVFTVLASVGVPSVVFLVPMPLVWSMPTSLALGVVGSMTSSLGGFLIARYVARDWVAARLPPGLRRFDEKLNEHALRTVILIRAIFFLTPPSTWFLALSRVPLSTFMVGTLIGGFPGIVFFIVVGGSFFSWIADRPPWVWAVTAAGLGVYFALRRHRMKNADPT